MDSGPNGAVLKRKLEDPHVASVLARLLDRIDELEQAVLRLTELVQVGPGALAAFTDAVDETIREAKAQDVDVDARTREALHLLKRLTDPKLAISLNRLLDLVEGSEGTLAMLGDTADDLAREMDLPARSRAGGALLEKATRPDTLRQLAEMFDVLLEADSGMLDAHAVRTLGITAQSLVAARERPERRASIWALLRAGKEPELQRALGFLLDFGKEFGARVDRAR
ncbi:MAG: DUF1641 domain-containing protein [Gemmatimonadota bacterium]